MTRVRPNPAHWHLRLRVDLATFRSPHQFRPALYVAGDLQHFELPAREALKYALDVELPDERGVVRCYRRLDAYWLAFLARRLDQALTLRPQHPTTTARWNSIIIWARERWTAPAVDKALALRTDARYRPPAMPAAA